MPHIPMYCLQAGRTSITYVHEAFAVHFCYITRIEPPIRVDRFGCSFCEISNGSLDCHCQAARVWHYIFNDLQQNDTCPDCPHTAS